VSEDKRCPRASCVIDRARLRLAIATLRLIAGSDGAEVAFPRAKAAETLADIDPAKIAAVHAKIERARARPTKRRRTERGPL
jgi:hypothetical protein